MIATIDSFSANRPDIVAACRESDVKRLEVFGSRARADATATSDIDLLVEFNDPLRPGMLDRYLSLREALATIFDCHVDLIESSAIVNPILRKRIDEDRKLLYAA